jgi:hypothetical protein
LTLKLELREPGELKALRRLEKLLLEMAGRLGGRGLEEFVRRRIAGAEEILRRPQLILDVWSVGRGAWMASILSTRYAGKPVPRRVVFRSLEGKAVEVEEREGLEDMVHFVEVSPRALKCTCQDSIITASAASKILGEPPRHVLCKHVIAVLALLASWGLVDPESPEYREALESALEAAKARIEASKRREREGRAATLTLS